MKYRELVNKFKHKYIIRFGAGILTVALLGTGIGYSVYARNAGQQETLAAESQEDQEKEEQDKEEKEQEILTQALESQTGQEEGNFGKEETVYAVADASGKTQSVIVSEWLKNPDKREELTDTTDLSEIENVKGDEEYKKNSDGTITWLAGGKDIYYQGTTKKELPVDMKITYQLDGKTMTPEELAGKSGKVTIRMDYVNKEKVKTTINGKQEEVSVPFTAVSGMILSEDFTNIKVTNGKVISDGKNQMVIGVAVPGLKESLQVKNEDFDTELELPEYVEVTADVENFSLDMTMTMYLSDILSGLQLDEDLDLSDLADSIDTLTDASSKLVDGSGELSDGLDTLKKNMGEYASGVDTLKQGVDHYTAGASQVNDGIAALKEGSNALVAGADSLADGMGKVSGSFTSENGLIAGAQALESGVKQLEDTLNAAMSEEEKEAVRNQAGAAVEETFQQGTHEAIAQQAASEFETGITAGGEAVGQQLCESELYTTMVEAIYQQKVFEAYQAQKEAVDTAIAGYAAMGQSVTITDVVEASYQQQAGHSIRSEVEAAVAATLKDTVAPQIVQGIAASGKGAMGENVAAACESAAKEAAGAAAVSGAEGAKSQIAEGVKNGGLVQGASALSAGVDQLYKEGISPLKQGMDSMKEQMPQLTAGIDALAEGSSQLVANNAALMSGASKLADATGQISSGVDKLKDGSSRLSDGILEFDEEGIQKLSEIYHGDVELLMDRVDAVLDAGKGYQTFTKKNEDVDGSVKFIVRTEGVKE